MSDDATLRFLLVTAVYRDIRIYWAITEALMSRAAFNVGDLGISSALQLTLWPARPEFWELTAKRLRLSARKSSHRGFVLSDTISYVTFNSNPQPLKARTIRDFRDFKLHIRY